MLIKCLKGHLIIFYKMIRYGFMKTNKADNACRYWLSVEIKEVGSQYNVFVKCFEAQRKVAEKEMP